MVNIVYPLLSILLDRFVAVVESSVILYFKMVTIKSIGVVLLCLSWKKSFKAIMTIGGCRLQISF